jgi:hypothetical protein
MLRDSSRVPKTPAVLDCGGRDAAFFAPLFSSEKPRRIQSAGASAHSQNRCRKSSSAANSHHDFLISDRAERFAAAHSPQTSDCTNCFRHNVFLYFSHRRLGFQI